MVEGGGEGRGREKGRGGGRGGGGGLVLVLVLFFFFVFVFVFGFSFVFEGFDSLVQGFNKSVSVSIISVGCNHFFPFLSFISFPPFSKDVL